MHHLVRRRALLMAGTVVLLTTGGARAWGDRVTGSGRIVSETRAVSGYSGVSLRGSFEVVLRASGKEGVELRGDDNLLPLIETRLVDDGQLGRVLELRWRDGSSVSSKAGIVATVDVATLRSIAVSGSGSVSGDSLATPSLAVRLAGSGDVALTRIKTDDLALSVAGSGDIKAGGRAGKLAIAISGSGDVDAEALESDEVSVRIAGSGDAAVTARKRLVVAISGSGDVLYRGDVQPQVSVAGSGHVKRR